MGWLWILLALLAIALLAWAFWPDGDVERVDAPLTSTYVAPETTGTTGTTMGTMTTGDAATLAAINQNPQQWVGREYSGTVSVAEVPTDRGFWVEENGQRMFAIVIDGPAEAPIDINPGQRLNLRGTVRDQAYLSQLPGEPISAGTRNIVQNQQVYLVADETAIQIAEAGQPQ